MNDFLKTISPLTWVFLTGCVLCLLVCYDFGSRSGGGAVGGAVGFGFAAGSMVLSAATIEKRGH